MKIILYLLLLIEIAYPQIRLYPKGDDSYIRNVKFYNDTIGVFFGENGKILFTEDAGNTLKDISIPNGVNISSIHFFNSSNMFVVANKNYETTDGGNSWFESSITLPFYRYVIHNDTTIFSGYNILYKSIDRGKTYLPISRELEFDNFVIFDDSTYAVYSRQMSDYRTEDYGKTWSYIENSAGLTDYLTHYGNKVYVNEYMTTLVSLDKGKTYNWFYTFEDIPGTVYDYRDTCVLILSDEIHYFTNNYNVRHSIYKKWGNAFYYASSPTLLFAIYPNGRVIKITDFGKNEKEIISSTFQTAEKGDVFIKGDDNFYLTSGNKVLHSSDRGLTWQTKTSIPFASLLFNENIWFNSGSKWQANAYYYTIDQGNIWYVSTKDKINSILASNKNPRISYFYNNQKYFGNGLLFNIKDEKLEKSSDYGNTWQTLTYNGVRSTYAIYFIDSLIGWRFEIDHVFDTTTAKLKQVLQLYYTEDAFNTHNLLSTNDNFSYFTYESSLLFYDKNIGYVGSYDGIRETTDGGLSFNKIFDKFTIKLLLWGKQLYAYTNDGSFYWIKDIPVNNNLLTLEDNKFPIDYDLFQNYPNPFNAATTIKYQLPNESKTMINIFNSIGVLIESIDLGNKSAGIHEYRYNAGNISSGVYYYQLKSGSYINTKKFVLLK